MNYKDILGWMTEYDLSIISDLAKLVPENSTIVEVGSMFGRSAACWATHVNKSTNIYCIDNWYSFYTQDHPFSEKICLENKFPLSGKQYDLLTEFKNNTISFSNIKMIQGHCPSQTHWDNIPIDLLFLDASHTNPSDWEILEYFMPFIKTNGIICGHDYEENQFPDVVKNVKKLELLFETKVMLFENSSIWVINKNG